MIDGLPKPDWQSDDGSVVLYCADCLDVLPQISDGAVDAVVTDPPYGISYQSAWPTDGPRFAKIAGDDSPAIDWISLARCGALFVFCEWRHAETFRLAIESSGVPVRSQVVWDRGIHGMGDLSRSWAPRHDLAWWACDDSFSFFGGRPSSVIRCDRVPAAEMLHPTQKPIALMDHILGSVSRPHATILDPFMGSGTTGVACIRTGRKFIGIEKEPKYFDISVRRIKDAIAEGGLFNGACHDSEPRSMFA